MASTLMTKTLGGLAFALALTVALLLGMVSNQPEPRTTTVVDETATALVSCLRTYPALTLAACELVVDEQEKKQAPPAAPLRAMAAR